MAVIWGVEVTENMVKHLNSNEISLLCDSLSDAVQEICKSYEVE
jgi:hypothetical protein